jgi:biopolymer transport protein ExbB
MNFLGRADARVGLWIAIILAAAVLFWGLPRGTGDVTYGRALAADAADALDAEPADAADAEPADASDQPDGAATGRRKADKPLGGIILSSGVFGGIFYGVLAIFSIASTAVVLERLVRLTRGKIVPPAFAAGLKNLIREKKDTVDNFRTLCEASMSPAARILRAGLIRSGRPLPEVEKSMEDAAARELAELRTRNKPLSVIGTVAPLVGLLGTVVGMIFAFWTASQAGLGKAELLAEGIYLALLTTAAGLTIAIPCLLFHAWFNARADKYLREIDELLLDTMHCFTRLEDLSLNGGPRIDSPTGDGRTASQSSKPVAAVVSQS